LASAGYVRAESREQSQPQVDRPTSGETVAAMSAAASEAPAANAAGMGGFAPEEHGSTFGPVDQSRIEFASLPIQDEESLVEETEDLRSLKSDTARDLDAIMREAVSAQPVSPDAPVISLQAQTAAAGGSGPTVREGVSEPPALAGGSSTQLPPLASAEKIAREVSVESLSNNIRPIGQLDESFIIATDNEGLLLIDQHVAHERVLFDKYRALESARLTESQQLLIPETFDLTPAQASIFDVVAAELEMYGFELMRLSGRTVAIKAAPADLPAGEARNMLAEILDTVDAEKKGMARETLRDDIAASLACHAAIKVNMPLSPEKMRWLIDRLLKTSSPTTCPHGRPVILRLATRDILKGFHRI
jgi:DNA mismatch repair ATPase MutL